MKKIIFLAGLPAVGKSTLARKIAERVDGLVLDIDEIKREIVDSSLVTSTIDPPEVRWQYYEKAIEKVFSLFEEGMSIVIVDEVFHLQFLRKRVEDLCTERGTRVSWIEVQCSYREVEKRLRANSRDGHILSTQEALRMYLLFEEIFEEFPTDKVNHIIFKNEGDCDIDSLLV